MENRAKTMIMILSVLLAISLACNAMFVYRVYSESFASKTRVDGVLMEGDRAPDFSVKLLTGETFTLSENKGKVVFLNFWATWCPPCVAEMPAIQALSEQYEDSVVFIGIDLAESTRKVQDFITEKGITYHIGLDNENAEISQNLYPTEVIPYTLVIDAKGIITQIFHGGGDQMHVAFEEAITEALNR